MSEQTTWLIRLSCAPYHDEQFAQALDIALACGAFGQSVALVLEGLALGALNPDQSAPQQHANIYKQLSAMPLYDVDRIYQFANGDSVGVNGNMNSAKHGGAPPTIEGLMIDTIDTKGWHELVANAKHVLSF